MATWRSVGLVAMLGLTLAACSGSGSGDDDDGSGGSSGTGGSGGSGATGEPKPCGSLTSYEASAIATSNVSSVLHNAVETLRFTEGSRLIERALGAQGGETEPFAFVDDAHSSIDEMVTDLATKVFVDANVESETEDSVTYHLTPDVNCPLDEEYASFDPDGAAAEQADCAAELEAHPVRYVVSRIDCEEGDAVSIALEVGQTRIRPGLLTASAIALGLTLDVAETVRAIVDDDPSATFDEDSAGSVSMRLEAIGGEIASFNLGIPSDLVIGALGNDEPLRLELDASPSALSLSATANSSRLTGDVNLEVMDVTFPFHDFIESAFQREVQPDVSPSDTVALHVGHLTTGFEFDRVAERLVLFGLGLGNGPATVRADGEPLLTVELNREWDHTVSLPIWIYEDDELMLSPTPEFDLELGYSMAAVESKVVDLEPFALEDRVRIALTGEPNVTLLRDEEGRLALLSRSEGPALRVNAGNFVMSSETLPDEDVSVAEEECLLYDPGADGEHDILRGYSGDECP